MQHKPPAHVRSPTGASHGELQPRRVAAPGSQALLTPGRPCVWQQGPTRHAAPRGAERVQQHPLMETSGLGAACWQGEALAQEIPEARYVLPHGLLLPGIALAWRPPKGTPRGSHRELLMGSRSADLTLPPASPNPSGLAAKTPNGLSERGTSVLLCP